MNILNKFKLNMGATLTDVVIAMLIIMLFTGILTTTFSGIYKNNIHIKMNAIAVDYAIKILEDIDKMPYEEVNNTLNEEITKKYENYKNYEAHLDIENYNKDDENNEDIIKIVTLTIKYNVIDSTEQYVVKKLKIKEM